MKDCIFITKEFPYFMGEAFIENEIKYLSNHFENVYLFVLNASKNDIVTRETPANVIIIPLSGIRSRFKYLYYLFCGIKRFDKRLKIKFNGIKKILLQLYSRGRASSIAKKIYSFFIKNRKVKNDLIIYSYWFDYQAIAAWIVEGKLSKSGYKATSVSRAHGYDLYWYRNFVGYLPFQRESIAQLNMVCPCSDDGTAYLQKKYPDFQFKIRTARLGTVDHGISVEPDSDDITFLTCCTLKPLKRMPLFAKAFVMLNQNGYQCKWICIGDGQDLEFVKQIIFQNNLNGQVVFTGNLKNKEVIDIYKNNKINFFCNVSTVEGLPVSIMEAMSFGVPVIATNVGGTKELVDAFVGRLISPDITESELYEEILKEIQISKEEYRQKRLSARIKWEKTASADRNYEDWMSFLNHL